MTITSKDYALLCKDSYNDHSIKQEVILGGIAYKVIDSYSNPVTGYHGTAYQRIDTKEVVIANRGTEKTGGPSKTAQPILAWWLRVLMHRCRMRAPLLLG